MTIPDKLVTAAAEAMARSEGKTLEQAPYMRDYATDALAAAFAALPGCEEAQPPPGYPVTFHHIGWDACLAALARMRET